MSGSLQPVPISLSQEVAKGLHAPHCGTQTIPMRVKNPIDPALNPMVQLYMAKH
jgi:hypothetical protein